LPSTVLSGRASTCARSLIRSACAGPVARTRAARTSRLLKMCMVVASVGEGGGVEEAPQPAHRVRARQRAAAAIGDLRVADAVGADPPPPTDTRRAHDALNLDPLLTLVHPPLLAAADQPVA